MQRRKLSAQPHSGTRTLFGKHFVRTGDISKEMGAFYSTLFNKRMESDYDDFVTFEADQVEQWIERAERFVDTVAGVIQSDR